MKVIYSLVFILFAIFLGSDLRGQVITEEGIDSKANLSGKWLGNKVKIRDGSCPIFGQPFLDMPCILEVSVDDFGFANITEYIYIKDSWESTKIPVAEVDDNLVISYNEIKVVKCGGDSRMNQIVTKGIFKQLEHGRWVLEMQAYDNMCPEWNCKYKIAYELVKESSLNKEVEQASKSN